jgi:hypothetical protein
MNEINAIFKSIAHKERNASKVKLSPNARAIYLRGFARLSKAEEVALSGFRVPTFQPLPKIESVVV